MIYFLQSTNGGPVKIGCTCDVERRRLELESHYGCPLALLAMMEGGRDEEREIHERFCALRLGRSEQFRPALELMAFIGRPLLVGSNPEAVEAMPATVEPGIKIIGVRASVEWAEWLERLGKRYRTTVAGLIDRAIAEWAASQGYEETPPERMP